MDSKYPGSATQQQIFFTICLWLFCSHNENTGSCKQNFDITALEKKETEIAREKSS